MCVTLTELHDMTPPAADRCLLQHFSSRYHHDDNNSDVGSLWPPFDAYLSSASPRHKLFSYYFLTGSTPAARRRRLAPDENCRFAQPLWPQSGRTSQSRHAAADWLSYSAPCVSQSSHQRENGLRWLCIESETRA